MLHEEIKPNMSGTDMHYQHEIFEEFPHHEIAGHTSHFFHSQPSVAQSTVLFMLILR